MKEKFAEWLVSIARRICPQKDFSFSVEYEPKKLAIGYHITKNDVKMYRKSNPQFKSHREALSALVEDTKKEIGTNIFAGIYKNKLISYNVKKSPWTADVTGELFVFSPK